MTARSCLTVACVGVLLLALTACAPPYRAPPPDPRIDHHASRTDAVPESLPETERAWTRDPARADSVLVLKGERKMKLFAEGRPFRTYRIALGFEPKGHKRERGDGRTPEGWYLLDFLNENSSFYRSMRVSYPNATDRLVAEVRGVNPGDNIMIHGLPNGSGYVGASHVREDWADGCIAVTNEEMDEILRFVAVGTPIEIRP